MGENINSNKFFTVEMDNASQDALRIMPTDYLEKLHPHQAMKELQDYIDTLESAVQHFSGEGTSVQVDFGRIGSLTFELELVRTFLSSFKQTYGTMH